ncbi:MAG: hypothetical protein H6590_06755 [Flavobacteriales bacterium]|nr:hypothetical protein [Flavobacteriales bacterium]HPF90663.1 hypothetical protein [Flavobacteriales bacterium]
MATSKSTEKAKRMDLAFASLLSKDDEEVLAAITRIDAEGDARAIRPLLLALANTPSPAIQQRITQLLFQVKAAQADEALFAALEDTAFAGIRATVLSTFWNAGIDVRGRLDTFVDIALSGTAAESFECLTVIENQDFWSEKEARAALRRLEAGVPAEVDPYKAAILTDLQNVLRLRLGKEEVSG